MRPAQNAPGGHGHESTPQRFDCDAVRCGDRLSGSVTPTRARDGEPHQGTRRNLDDHVRTFISDVPTADSTARGEVVWEAGPGGFTLLEKEHVSTAAGEQFLLLILWWDNGTHSLRAMRCDNSGAEACDVASNANSTLSWDGKAFMFDLRVR